MVESTPGEAEARVLPEAMAELAQLLLSEDALQTAMRQLARLSVRVVPAAFTAGITVVDDAGVVQAVAADPVAEQLHGQQVGLPTGPTADALREGTAVHVPDMTTEARWDGLPGRLVDAGIVSAYAVPLTLQGRSRGALTLYADLPRVFEDERSQADIAMVVGMMASWFATTPVGQQADTLTAELQQAMAVRALVDRAVGVLMATHDWPVDRAWAFLRHAAFTRGLLVQQMAENVLGELAQVQTAQPAPESDPA